MSENEHESKSKTVDPKGSSNDRRRRLLTTLAIGGAAGASMPTKWVKPVVDSVVLPAHAQTTTPGVQVILGAGGGGSGTGPGPAPGNSLMDDVVDFFINPAQAGSATVNDFCIEIRVTKTNDDVTAVTVTKVCHDACKPGVRWWDQTTGNHNLTQGPPGTWTGNVGNFNVPVQITSINTDASVIANVTLGAILGTIEKGETCDCSCGTYT